MATWSSFEKDKLLVEGWRKFLVEEPQVVYGLNSTDNPDSLQNLLKGVVDEEQIRKIINLIASAADDEGVMLEAVSLQGSKSEQDRVFSGDTTREILQGLASLQLDPAKLKNVVKVLNQWGKLNTVKFEKPAPATPAMVTGEPDEAEGAPTPAAEPDPEPDDFEEEPTEEVPTMGPVVDAEDDEEDTRPTDPAAETGELEDEERVAKEKAAAATPEEREQKEEKREQQVQILRQEDDPDKGFLGLLRNNPFNFMYSIPSNILDGLITVYRLEPEQRTKSNISKVVIQEVFDIGDSIAFDLLPDNTPYLLKERQFKQLFTGVLTNITTKGGKALDAAEKLCKFCKGTLAGKALISRIPRIGGLVVALAQAIAVIACPIAAAAERLRPLLKGDASGFSENPFFTAGLSGKGVGKEGNKLVINDGMTIKHPGIPKTLQMLQNTEFENKQDVEMYVLGLKSYGSILSGFEKIDTSEILADDPGEAEPAPTLYPDEPAALQESKQVIRWKQLAGIS